MENTSGKGKSAVVPAEIQKWNWGAFWMNWIWGLGNKTYIALLCLIPLVGFVMIVVLGAKGSKWAWQKKRWDSVDHFQKIQKKWAWWGLAVFLILFVMSILPKLYLAIFG